MALVGHYAPAFSLSAPICIEKRTHEGRVGSWPVESSWVRVKPCRADGMHSVKRAVLEDLYFPYAIRSCFVLFLCPLVSFLRSARQFSTLARAPPRLRLPVQRMIHRKSYI